ncbi:hypothetical protein A6E01_19075 (plasmid) [Vibrio breoganii]|uniref:Flagellar hook-length control protein-like C-terminal domain-containing protein n=1 Tax=Vibrio breoganii TaxID=553239 RepID=A0AAN1CU94_9VIBR|nr:flagellar hook-length control protein FliK [Vibrio breoganii]ANO35317.1 hypothetical protein A6E01_19075 [Vibrio breoganii]
MQITSSFSRSLVEADTETAVSTNDVLGSEEEQMELTFEVVLPRVPEGADEDVVDSSLRSIYGESHQMVEDVPEASLEELEYLEGGDEYVAPIVMASERPRELRANDRAVEPKVAVDAAIRRSEGVQPTPIQSVQAQPQPQPQPVAPVEALVKETATNSLRLVDGMLTGSRGADSLVAVQTSQPNGGSLTVARSEFVFHATPSDMSNTSQLTSKLAMVLGDKVNLQVAARQESTTMRLDPPELGRIDVRLKMDGDKVSVQLVPSSAVGREMISQTIDKLRIELSSAYGEVNVSLGESSHDQSGGSQSSLEGEGLFMADSSLSAGGEQSTQSSESQSRSSSLGTA